MSLDDIWDEPIAPPPKPPTSPGNNSPLKRPRQSLFLPDSNSDDERPPKRATPAPPPARPDVDALFDDLDKGEEDDDLRYKPLVPALDLAKLTKEAEERHARARRTGYNTLTASSKTTSTAGKDSSAGGQEKDKPADGEKKGRKVLPKLDEERLVGPDGFPLLIEGIKGFKPKGKGNEHTDLSRLLQVYQFWTHKMYPKTSFKDTIDRVEKLCHSKRMQVRLSVWRDEFKGITNNKENEDSDVIDLTESALVEAERDGEDKESRDHISKSDQASSRPSSLPPASSEVDDDDFDIDAVIRAEEERLTALRATTAGDSGVLRSSPPLTIPEKAASKGDTDAMDLDEANLWDAVDNSTMLFDLPENNIPPAPQADDDDMWDIIDQIEQGGQSKPVTKMRIPTSGVNLTPSVDSTQSGNMSRATNDDDWDEMYS